MVANRITKLLKALRRWSDEQVYFENDNYFTDLIASFDQAKQTIEIESYIFSQDKLGKRVVASLLRAAERGVSVRLIIDGLGSKDWQLNQVSDLTNAGIKVKIYHPLPWHLSFYHQVKIQRSFFYKFLYLFSQINKRDHRKLYIIDQQTAWTGSLNLSSSHLASGSIIANHEKHNASEQENWFDCGVMVGGEPVQDLSATFDEIWRGISLRALGNSRLPFRTNNNVIKRQRKNLELIQLIRSSQKNIWIISAYLAPSRRIIKALNHARKRGIDVKLVVSKRSDVAIFPMVSNTCYRSLLSADVQIFECDSKIVHAKTMMLDDMLVLGSSNLNHRSFLHDLELDVILTKASSLKKYSMQYKQLIAQSSSVTLEKLDKQSWYRRMLGKLIWRLRYWL